MKQPIQHHKLSLVTKRSTDDLISNWAKRVRGVSLVTIFLTTSAGLFAQNMWNPLTEGRPDIAFFNGSSARVQGDYSSGVGFELANYSGGFGLWAIQNTGLSNMGGAGNLALTRPGVTVPPMLLNTAGRVGINSASPSAALHIAEPENNGVRPILMLVDNHHGYIRFNTGLQKGHYNPLTRQNDQGVFWKQGTGLILAPWHHEKIGFRMSPTGRVGFNSPAEWGGLSFSNTGDLGVEPILYLEDVNVGSVQVNTNLLAGHFSHITQGGDKGIFWTDEISTHNQDAGFVIAPRGQNANGLRIQADGKVGVGLALPQAKIDVNGMARAHGFVTAQDNFIVTTSGKVGVGTTTPTSGLEVVGGATLDIINVSNKFYSNLSGELVVEPQSENKGGVLKLKRMEINSSHLWSIEHDTNGNFNVATESVYPGGRSLHNRICVRPTGQVAIGTENFDADPEAKLIVNGKIHAKKVEITTMDWADYVFDTDYALMPISQVSDYVKNEHHLPGIPSAEQVIADGIDVGEMNKLLLQKIEELTLYVIQQQEAIEALQNKQ